VKVLGILLLLGVAANAQPAITSLLPSDSAARVRRPPPTTARFSAPVTGQRTEYRGSGQVVHLTAMSDGSTWAQESGGGTGCAGAYSGMGRFKDATLLIRSEDDPSCQIRLTRFDRRLSVSGGRGMARGSFVGELRQRTRR
jgi:hypothetical protein